MTESKPRPWERQRSADGTLEPARWFHRFDAYFRPLGPERTIEQAWQLWKQSEAKSSKAKRPNSYWYKAAKDWQWWERAEKWDEYEAEIRHEVEAEERERRRRERIEQALRAQDVGLTIISKAEVDAMAVEEARRLLGEGRRIWAEGVKQERLERGEPTEITEERGHTVKLYGFADNFPDAEEEADGEG